MAVSTWRTTLCCPTMTCPTAASMAAACWRKISGVISVMGLLDLQNKDFYRKGAKAAKIALINLYFFAHFAP
jgi:hypothetical protein